MNAKISSVFVLFYLTNSCFILLQKVGLSGYVKDSTSGETLIGASVVIKQKPLVQPPITMDIIPFKLKKRPTISRCLT